MYMAKVGHDLKQSYQEQIRQQYRGQPLSGPLCVSATLYFGTHRRQDIDNFNKLFFDACTGLVWEDDSQIEDLRLVKSYDKECPRIDVTVTRL